VDQSLGSRYVLQEKLGRGAMGQVFAGTVRESGARVAIKVLKPELVSDPEAVARFMQERQILTSIRNPNVVRVVDLVAEGETLAIVMELVEGQDLRRHLREQRTLPPAEAVRLLIQLLYGLSAVHGAGVVHRDVKPENLLLDASAGRPVLKLTDFGVARLSYGASLTKLSSLIGTPEYMAPELAESESAGYAADLYSAGIVLYEMLAGRTPFAGAHPLAILQRQVSQAPQPIPGIPETLWDQIARLLAKEPAGRPASAADAAAALVPELTALDGQAALPPMPVTEAGAFAAVADGNSTVLRPRDRYGSADDAVGEGDVTVPAASGEAGSQPALAGAAESGGTMLRHRDRAPAPGPQDSRLAAPAATGWSRLRSRRAIMLAAAVMVIVAAAAVLVPAELRHPASATTTPTVTTASYTFAPQQYPAGLRLARHWTLAGKKGSVLTETITASSNGKALNTQLQEAIPDSIASSLQTIQFSPAPTRILRTDPVVEWQIQIPAGRSVTVSYRATVPADGASHARLARWAQDFQTLQAQLPTPEISSPAHPSPSATPTVSSPATVPAITAPSAPTVVISTAPATSQLPEPAASMAPGAQTYTSGSLSTGSSAVTARVYFGQLDSIISALSGQVSFNTSSSLLASNPDLCTSTVVFSGVSSPTGAVYAEGLGSGWTAAENAPSQDTQNGTLHQQLVVPPAGISAGASWQGSAELVAGNLTVQSGSFGLHLESQNGATQTWLADGQTIICNS
jgi:hypothetical protein